MKYLIDEEFRMCIGFEEIKNSGIYSVVDILKKEFDSSNIYTNREFAGLFKGSLYRLTEDQKNNLLDREAAELWLEAVA